MSIHWIKNVFVDGKNTTMEILMGDHSISDKCYVRINSGKELWFVPKGESRNEVMDQGIEILKNKFSGQKITTSNGEDFSWEP